LQTGQYSIGSSLVSSLPEVFDFSSGLVDGSWSEFMSDYC